MVLEETEAMNDFAGKRQQQLNRPTNRPLWESSRVSPKQSEP
jgi:hypothetical protein